MRFFSFTCDQRGGTIILMTILILTGIISASLVAADTIRLSLVASRTQADATKAFYAAEAGAERTLWEIRKKSPAIDLITGGCSDDEQYKFCYANDTAGDFVNCKKVATEDCDTSPSYDRQKIATSNSEYSIWATTTDLTGENITVKSRGYNQDTCRVVEVSF